MKPTPKPIEKIPEHLMPFIASQEADLYTPMDQAAWRFILRISKEFFKEHAHQKYIAGITETGMTVERIPNIREMDEALRVIGWRAVGVVGFIPPTVFMEFQSLGVLPIACDMRQTDHIEYSAAPDIVHEAAGHAPMLADPDYAEFLRTFGRIASKAITTKHDHEVYLAIRHLSDIKEDPKATKKDIDAAQKSLEQAIAANEYVSEASELARMYWWTVEYGLVGDLQQPKIYGAGLLSSVGESFSCISPTVAKIPMSLDCMKMSYDITRPQPQLFVTPDFRHLTRLLEEYATQMAASQGGMIGLTKAKVSQAVVTVELDSGLQISGILDDFIIFDQRRPCYLQFGGPTQLSFERSELPNHSSKRHPEGFGCPVGLLKDFQKSASELSQEELRTLGIIDGRSSGRTIFSFNSGVKVEGIVTSTLERDGKLLLITFTDCKVTQGDRLLFDPSWGEYDMACGYEIPSVFGGPSDTGAYLKTTGTFPRVNAKPSSNLTNSNKELNLVFEMLRKIRESKSITEEDRLYLKTAQEKILKEFPDDFLFHTELLELFESFDERPSFLSHSEKQLNQLASTSSTKRMLIERGVGLLSRFSMDANEQMA